MNVHIEKYFFVYKIIQALSLPQFGRYLCDADFTILSQFEVFQVMSGVLQMMQECWTGSPVCRLTAMNVRKAVDRHAASLGWKVRS